MSPEGDGADRGGGPERSRTSSAWVWAATSVLAAAALFALAASVRGGSLTNVGSLATLGLAVAGVLCLAGWWAERARASAAGVGEDEQREALRDEVEGEREALREARGRGDGLREELRGLSSRLDNREDELRRERFLRQQSHESRRAAQAWGRDLQAEVSRLYGELGNLADPKDVPSTVLRLARNLLEAEKGLMLSRSNAAEGIGNVPGLGLVASEGFENDPKKSALARRFAEEVLERDRAVREEDPDSPAGDGGTAADREIENLVAIPIYLRDEFSGVVVCANNPRGFRDFEDEVLLSVGDQAGAVLENSRLRGELRETYVATVRMLAEALEAKDPFMRGHAEDVAGRAAATADRLGLGPDARERAVLGALLRDVGKIGISERVLLKPGPLTPAERSIVELHPRIACRLLDQVPALKPVSRCVLHHHERHDGAGYLSGLAGDEIPLESRIVSVVDAFAAMTGERPYRERVSVEEACRQIELGAGSQFDPEVADAFVAAVRESPTSTDRNALSDALNDPALRLKLRSGEPLLGHAPTPAPPASPASEGKGPARDPER